MSEKGDREPHDADDAPLREADDADEVVCQATHGRFDVQMVEQQGSGVRNRHRQQPHSDSLPQRLPHHMWNLRMLSRTDVLRHDRIDRHQHADQRDDDDVPYRATERHTGQVLCRRMPGHGDVGHAHAHGCELPDQDRPGQFPQGRGFAAYGTAKAALAHYTRLSALDLAPRIRVNAIAPGSILTSALEIVASNDELRDPMEKATPMRRLGDPLDIAAAAVYLASPAGSYLTGKTLEVDGGITFPNLDLPIPDL